MMKKDKSAYTRREFLKTSAQGLAISGVSPFFMQSPLFSLLKEGGTVSYRILGRTGLKVTMVSFGVMTTDNAGVVAKAIRMGINHFDTANVYQSGNNERMLGEVIKKENARDKLIVATKVALPRDKAAGRFTADATTAAFIRQYEEGLKRLQSDYADIVYVHNILSPEMVFHEPVLEALTRLKKEGKVRCAGISTHHREEDVIREALKRDFYDVILTAYNFKKDNREAIRQAVAAAAQKGIGIVAMKTQVGGYDVSSLGISPFQACLKWALNDPHVACAIPGTTNFKQLDENFAVMKQFALSPKDLKQLSSYSAYLNGTYCQGCGQCVWSCIRHLDIPEYMRSHMYLTGYRDTGRSLGLLREIASYTPADPCSSCQSCTARCPNGIDIGGRMKELHALQA
jgi:predicted aldo/keto reductase-like oxidoreductase